MIRKSRSMRDFFLPSLGLGLMALRITPFRSSMLEKFSLLDRSTTTW